MSEAEALVNPVNCKGTMGCGLAKEFRTYYPEIETPYKRACASRLLKPGTVQTIRVIDLFTDLGYRWIVNFPTKLDWRDYSKLEYIESGLKDLSLALCELGAQSVALPALGCGHGGLEWDQVKELIIDILSPCEREIIIYLK